MVMGGGRTPPGRGSPCRGLGFPPVLGSLPPTKPCAAPQRFYFRLRPRGTPAALGSLSVSPSPARFLACVAACGTAGSFPPSGARCAAEGQPGSMRQPRTQVPHDWPEGVRKLWSAPRAPTTPTRAGRFGVSSVWWCGGVVVGVATTVCWGDGLGLLLGWIRGQDGGPRPSRGRTEDAMFARPPHHQIFHRLLLSPCCLVW